MTDHIESLQRLATLHKDGVLSEEEFANEKARILKQMSESGSDGTVSSIWKDRRLPFVAIAIVAGLVVGVTVWDSVVNRSKSPPSESDKPISRKLVQQGEIGFTDLTSCEPNETLAGLLAKLKAGDGSGAVANLITIPGTDRQVEPSSRSIGDKAGTVVRALPLGLTWHNLELRQLRALDWNDGRAIQLDFANPIGDVRTQLRQIYPNLAFKEGETAQGGGAIGLERLPGSVRFSCFVATGVETAAAPLNVNSVEGP
ncbi:SHOCT domain-containing protein [Sphingomonas sp. ASV193]|uniref:SHOCT domain-containing protein n=1 Tax=Sphingomonas sp. ASV193 TaxID=3144405 RepID=UPI0032E8DCB9